MTGARNLTFIRNFFSKGQLLLFHKGDIILGNDPAPSGVYYIESGYVKIYAISDSGDEYLHIIYGPGDVFPLTWAYIDAEPDSEFYEAIADSRLRKVARTDFTHAMQSDPELSYAMGVQLAYQFQVFLDRIDNLEYKKAAERVVYHLLFLAHRFGVRRGSEITIQAPITHELFANSINLARETVSRQIEILEKEQLVRNHRTHMVIQDVPRLEHRLSHPSNIQNWEL